MTDKLAIATDNRIVLDGVATDYRVRQMKDRTEVYGFKVPWNLSSERFTLSLPHAQYSTSHDKPACGHGRTEFYNDVKEAIARHEKAPA